MKHKTRLLVFMLMTFALVNVLKAQSKIEIGHVNPGEIASASFELKSVTLIQINTVEACFPDRNFRNFWNKWNSSNGNNDNWGPNLLFYGWILDSETRKVVWHSLEQHSDILEKKSEYIHEFEDKISLPAGEYEIYYTGAKNNMNNLNDKTNSWRWLEELLGLTDTQFNTKYADKLFMSVSVENNSLVKTDIKNVLSNIDKDAVFKATQIRNSENITKEFSLSKSTTLNIYSLGEGRQDGVFDYAWIYNLDQNKLAWMMHYDNTASTGGAKKNIIFNNNVTLPAGNYKICYKTDDSHSFNNWNTFPPDDPFYWGIVVKIPNASERQNYKEIKNYNSNKPIVEITKVRSDEYRSQGFSVKSSMDVHIVCLGEGFVKDELADYGIIINADSRETVWKMKPSNIKSAGGANKNRMVDEIIHLEKGNYVVSYATDDSHAYFDWNDEEPFDPNLWGISIWAVNKSDIGNVSLFSENDYKSQNIITQITRVRDDADINKSFELNKETKIKVYAIGEGTSGRMVDYGWIENSTTGQTVWEMTYRRSENAGGAKKNRMLKEVISLPRGNYKLFYTTDGSHSFNDWNDDPPSDRNNYGITLTFVDN